MLKNQYIGRFAPSPTGSLHQGSLLTAVASFLQAKQQDGQWLVRMEDLDPPREVPGAADDILRCLDAFAMGWDGSVVYQSQASNYYQQALDQLQLQGKIYSCSCSRSQIKQWAKLGVIGLIYTGHCRDKKRQHMSNDSLRLVVPEQLICVEDGIRGKLCQNLFKEIGDIVLKRADGYWAYQLAVVVDDIRQGINEVVRGSDLFSNTPTQAYLFQLFDQTRPRYLHLPLITTDRGEKLSKQTGATAIDYHHAVKPQLIEIFRLLQMPTERALQDFSLDELWQWGIRHWQVEKLIYQDNIIQTRQADS